MGYFLSLKQIGINDTATSISNLLSLYKVQLNLIADKLLQAFVNLVILMISPSKQHQLERNLCQDNF